MASVHPVPLQESMFTLTGANLLATAFCVKNTAKPNFVPEIFKRFAKYLN
jgi:hypothetical protein